MGLTLHVGVSGAGKTYALRRCVLSAVASGRRVVVYDRLREWATVPPELAALSTRVSNAGQIDAEAKRGKRLIVFNPPGVLSYESHLTHVQSAAQWVLDQKTAGGAGLMFPEAHRVAPSGRLPPELEEIATCHRHYATDLWCDTQRISLLNRTVTEQSETIRIFAVVGDNDRRVIRDLGGRDLVSAVDECSRRLAAGERGWHVELGVHRVGPYEPRRF